MADPIDLDGFSGGSWPPDNVEVVKPTMRTFVQQVAQRVRALVAGSAGFEGELVAGKNDGSGPTFASLSSAAALSTGGIPLIAPQLIVPVTGTSVTPAAKTQQQALFICTNAGATTVSLTLDASGAAGIGDGYLGYVLRAGAGTVGLSLGAGLTFANPSSDQHVQSYLPATFLVYGGLVYFWGYTSA